MKTKNTKPKIAISIGDLNGIGLEIALKSHEKISKLCTPIYCINNSMLIKSAEMLDIKIPKDFDIHNVKGEFEIKPGKVSRKSGKFSYDSFNEAINLANLKKSRCNMYSTYK